MIRLKDPEPGKNRWGQAFEFIAGWLGLNILFTKLLLDWLLDAPLWLQWTSVFATFTAALFIEVIEIRPRGEKPPPTRALGDSASSTSRDGAAVTYQESS